MNRYRPVDNITVLFLSDLMGSFLRAWDYLLKERMHMIKGLFLVLSFKDEDDIGDVLFVCPPFGCQIRPPGRHFHT